MTVKPNGAGTAGTGQNMPAVVFEGVTKAFGATLACRNLSFSIPEGTLHAIVGENGAGKSTAMKLLYGLHRADAGRLFVHGQAFAPHSPRTALAHGIGMVHQHFLLAGPASGLDNILLSSEPGGKSWPRWTRFLRPLQRRAARAQLVALARSYGLAVELDCPVEELAVGVQQRLEVLKLLFQDVGILILDEPTAVLTPEESHALYTNLKKLKTEGKTVIVITHKLREVLAHADAVTVMRRGAVVTSQAVKGMTESELAELMVGRPVRLAAAPTPPRTNGRVALELAKVTLGRGGEKARLRDVTFQVQAGEIVGIAGVEGNGQKDLLELLIDPYPLMRRRRGLHATGKLHLLGQPARKLRCTSRHRGRPRGLGMIPEDRHRQGLVLSYDLTRNYLLGQQRTLSRGWGYISVREARSVLAQKITAYDIRPPDPDLAVASLSGGNQQKLIVARECAQDPSLLVAAQPTRGVDVGSIEFIHERLIEARDNGCGILLVSSSLEEVLALSDRILVMFDGAIVGEFARGGADEKVLGRLMGGGSVG